MEEKAKILVVAPYPSMLEILPNVASFRNDINMTVIIDEHGRICLGSVPWLSWRNTDVIEALAGTMLLHGTSEYSRSDNGSEFIARKLCK